MAGRQLRKLIVVCLATGLAVGSATTSAQNLLTDMGAGFAAGINTSGQVALSTGIYSNGTVTPLGILPGDTTNVIPNAINASGQVAGDSILSPQSTLETAVFYNNGVLTSFGASAATLEQSFATGINSSGQIVGYRTVQSDLYSDGFIYTNGVLTDIGGLPNALGLVEGMGGTLSVANGINDAGQVTGAALNNDDSPTLQGTYYGAFIYDNGTWTNLGPGGGYAINAAGQVTGVLANQVNGQSGVVGFYIPNLPNSPGVPFGSSSKTPIIGHAFIYSNGTMTDLGTLPGGTTAAGYAINTTGQIVGASDGTGFSGQHAFFYDGGLTDMNALVSATDPLQQFVTLTDAHGINDSRMIVVNGIDSRTQLQHAYLLQGSWLDVAPGPLSFPSQAIGTVSSAQIVTLTNSGSTVMALGTISTSANFSQTKNCGASLAPSASCTVVVTFTPIMAGNPTGALTVISAGVPITVPLSGVTPIQVNISSSAATTTTGVPVKLTWTASPGSTCTAKGGSAADGWTGTVAVSGTQSVTESTAGTYSYGLSCIAGTQSQSNQTSVVVAWPSLTVSLTASPTTITSGKSTTLTWTSTNAKTCVASGGGTSDGWAGTTQATSGSAVITEPVVVASPLTLTYTLTCSNSGTSQSTPASVKVVLNPPVKSGGGGGGAVEPMSVLFLAVLAALRRSRQSRLRECSRSRKSDSRLSTG